MTTFQLIKHSKGNYFIQGDLTFLSLDQKKRLPFDFLKDSTDNCIDLEKVTNADSAGLALVLEWIKKSRRYNTKLTFKNIPQQILTLARLSGLDLNEYMTDIS